MEKLFLALLICSTHLKYVASQGKCSNMPKESQPGQADWWPGEWEYFESNQKFLKIADNGNVNGNIFDGASCEMLSITKNHSSISAFVWGNIILKKGNCFGCLLIQQRTVNVMEFKESDCTFATAQQANDKCNLQTLVSKFKQLYRRNVLQVNCKNTLEGVYQFHYEFQDNVGICNNPENRLISCQEPGSAYDDNTRIRQYYRTCPGNTRSKNENIEWRCLGTWRDPGDPHKIYSAITNNVEPIFQQRVRCTLTQDNQQLPNNQQRYTMSSNPSCNELQDEYQGPERILRQPAMTPEQSEALTPTCMLPQNFSGAWFTSSQYDSTVKINATHIQFNTLYTSFSSVDTFFSCQQTRDTRFLMKQVTLGRCEIDYVCFEFLPRHQNIIRFRMGKPFRAGLDFKDGDSLQEIFTEACSWSAFTVSRTENLNYVYQTFILDPPAPVECPIGGIYNFTQTGIKEFKYQTRIRGVTDRPRVGYQCDNVESEFKVCSGNPKTVNLDAERCATVDHVGRPIGEYDEPDNFLQCVGYWQENQQSYLVTYDTEDSVSNYRCWVYERLGWKDIRMSRALRAACGSMQTPRSYTDVEGASLMLELHENEREFDDCPQKFLDGRDPYMKSSTVYVLTNKANYKLTNNILLLAGLLFISVIHRQVLQP